MRLFPLIIGGYLLGSIPTAYLVGRAHGGIDIREHGTKNMGASNTHMVLGVFNGALVLIIDVAKGTAAVFLGRWLTPDVLWAPYAAGTLAVIGHIYPVFAGFRGGKGAATIAGFALGIHYLLGLGVLGIFSVVGFIINSLAVSSMLGFAFFPIVVLVGAAPWPAVAWTIVAAGLCIYRHWPNLQKFLRGEEIPFRSGLMRKHD